LNAEKEGVALDAALAWAKAEMKRNPPKLATDAKEGEGLRVTLGEVFNCIRLPLLDLNEVALKITPNNLLSQDQMLALFTYLGQRASAKDNPDRIAKIPIDSSLKQFNAKERTGRSIFKTVDFSPPNCTSRYNFDNQRGYVFNVSKKCTIVGVEAEVGVSGSCQATLYCNRVQVAVANLPTNSNAVAWVQAKFDKPVKCDPNGGQYSLMIFGTGGTFTYNGGHTNFRTVEPFTNICSKYLIDSDNSYQLGIKLQIMG